MRQEALLLPVKNGEKYLQKCLNNAFQLEGASTRYIVVVNDGSGDGTREILEEYKNIHIVHLNKSLGLSTALNVGFSYILKELPHVQYIGRIDVDDLNEFSRITKQIDFLRSHPEVDIVGASNICVDTNGSKRNLDFPSSFPLVRWEMLFYCSVAHPSVVFRVNSLKKVIVSVESKEWTNPLPFRDTLYSGDACEDYALWMRLLYEQRFLIANVPSEEPLVCLRKHSGNVSKTQRENAFEIRLQQWKSMGVNEMSAEILTAFTNASLMHRLCSVQLEEAFDCIVKAFRVFELEYYDGIKQVRTNACQRLREILSILLVKDSIKALSLLETLSTIEKLS